MKNTGMNSIQRTESRTGTINYSDRKHYQTKCKFISGKTAGKITGQSLLGRGLDFWGELRLILVHCLPPLIHHLPFI
jgi:hypothetical protein